MLLGCHDCPVSTRPRPLRIRHWLVLCLAVGTLSLSACSAMELSALKASAPTEGPQCRPAVEDGVRHFIIGYGSLIQQASRTSTAPQASPAVPIDVRGFRRGFFATGQQPGFNTVYLGIVPDAESHFNGVLFNVPAEDVQALDRREGIYCRVAVPPSAVTMLQPGMAAPDGVMWVYVNQARSIGLPSDTTPIIQSYVDIFLSGCLDIAEQTSLPGFAEDCVTTTTDWSPYWVNDRIFPRMPQAHQPQAKAIDTLLQRLVPRQFAAIRIE